MDPAFICPMCATKTATVLMAQTKWTAVQSKFFLLRFLLLRCHIRSSCHADVLLSSRSLPMVAVSMRQQPVCSCIGFLQWNNWVSRPLGRKAVLSPRWFFFKLCTVPQSRNSHCRNECISHGIPWSHEQHSSIQTASDLLAFIAKFKLFFSLHSQTELTGLWYHQRQPLARGPKPMKFDGETKLCQRLSPQHGRVSPLRCFHIFTVHVSFSGQFVLFVFFWSNLLHFSWAFGNTAAVDPQKNQVTWQDVFQWRRITGWCVL